MAQRTSSDILSQAVATGELRLIDLSVSLKSGGAEPDPPKIKYIDHRKGAWLLSLGAAVAGKRSFAAKLWAALSYLLGNRKICAADFPQGMGLALENVKCDTHSGTHMDAPWHFGPRSGDQPAKTIDEIPLEWCIGHGVVLDLTHIPHGALIKVEDLQAALDKINYRLKPLDIVLLRTDADKHYERDDYLEVQPGMSREATLWLLEQGIKVIGIDAFGFDRSWTQMLNSYSRSKGGGGLWPAHFVGREKEYCHIEKMANLDKIPQPYGFRVICFPVKIAGASAGWVRPVAIV